LVGTDFSFGASQRAPDRVGEVPQVHKKLYLRFGKRLFDLAVASAALIIAAPILIGVAAAVRLRLGRGVIFRQRRTGRYGQDFMMYKFRTMLPSRRQEKLPFEGPDRRQTHKHDNDPRHTRLGTVLRKTSLDELPQLFNVLYGEMSLVGPRPELAEVVDQYGLRGHPRHSVPPGITGHWQIGVRNEGQPLHECFDEDLKYLQSVSLVEDIKILGKTATVLLSAGGR
jgi:lipopolysaccharide/colanic/teichoic acid biosynthesis glycosyltransferase